MEDLRRLVRLLEEFSPKSYPLINFQDETTLDVRLYNLIKEEKIKTDDEAALELYGTSKLSASYRMLKSRFKKKMINHIHFLNLPESKFSAVDLARAKCASMLFEAESLKAVHELKTADKILDQALFVAIENEINEYIVVIFEQKLWLNQLLCDNKKYNTDLKKLTRYYEIEKSERIATRIFQLRMLRSKSFNGNRIKLLDSLPEDIRELEVLWEKTKSSKIYYFLHVLSIQHEELRGNYHAISDLIESAEILLHKKVLHKNWFNFRYYSFIRIYALLQSKQYKLGLSLAERYLIYFDAGSLNWFAFMENYLLLALHSKEYDLFYIKFQDIVNSNIAHKLPSIFLERWKLLSRYAKHILSQRRGISIDIFEDEANSSSVLPKDKEGYGLAILIVEIMDELSKNSCEDNESNIERLRKYISKFLRGAEAERARLFLRLLMLVYKENFQINTIRANCEKLLNKLKNTPSPGDAFAEVEIMPYEDLWELVLDIVEKHNKTLTSY